MGVAMSLAFFDFRLMRAWFSRFRAKGQEDRRRPTGAAAHK
jgi:hypothetical protein